MPLTFSVVSHELMVIWPVMGVFIRTGVEDTEAILRITIFYI